MEGAESAGLGNDGANSKDEKRTTTFSNLLFAALFSSGDICRPIPVVYSS